MWNGFSHWLQYKSIEIGRQHGYVASGVSCLKDADTRASSWLKWWCMHEVILMRYAIDSNVDIIMIFYFDGQIIVSSDHHGLNMKRKWQILGEERGRYYIDHIYIYNCEAIWTLITKQNVIILVGLLGF